MAGGIYFYRVSRCLIDTRLRPIYRNRVGIWRFSFIEYGRDIVGINVSFFYFRVGIALGRRELFVQFAIAIQVISIEDKRFIETRFSLKGAYDTTRAFFATQSDTTAVFCMSDTVAMGVIRALTDMGRRVPEALSALTASR